MRALSAEATALWRNRGLLAMMVRRELAARHAGSVLGFFWLYAQPLLTLAAYYLVFDVIFQLRFGDSAPTRAVGAYLIVGLIPWMAFADAVSRGMNSLVEAGPMLQKNPLPPALFPARAVLMSAVIFLPLMVVMVVAYGPLHRFALALLLLPAVLAAMLASWLLIAQALAILTAAVRDIAQFVTFYLAIGVFFSPVLFLPEMFPRALAWLLWTNPMTPAVLSLQALLLTGQAPAPGAWFGLLMWVLVPAVAVNLLAARSREQLIDWL